MNFYCLKCRSNVEVPIGAITTEYLKNNRTTARANCPNCKTKMSRFIKS